MARRGKAGGGMGKTLFTAVWLVIVAGALLGWARANDIDSPEALWGYAQSWSDKTGECIGENPKTLEDLACDGSDGEGPSSGEEGENPGDGPSGEELPSDPEVQALDRDLTAIPVKDKKEVAYNRADWRHWSDLDKNGCDAREDVLLSQGKNVVTEPDDACDAVSGDWTSPYEGLKITNPSSIDIDHVIPLGYAATHGGQEWPREKKEKFANDFTHLLATSASENRSKSDKGPGAYMPDEVKYWCTYSTIWIKTAKKYDLWLEPADQAALRKGLATC